MTRCSTSSAGSLVSCAMMEKGILRSDVGRLNTDSINAIRQIFWRRKA